MSKTSQLHLELQEAEYNNQKQQQGINFLTEQDYILNKKKELEAYKSDLKIKKEPVVQGIVKEIKEYTSKYGYSYAIILDGQSATRYYFNCKAQDTVYRLFEVGKKTAFTTVDKVSKNGNKCKIVDMVFYTFC